MADQPQAEAPRFGFQTYADGSLRLDDAQGYGSGPRYSYAEVPTDADWGDPRPQARPASRTRVALALIALVASAAAIGGLAMLWPALHRGPTQTASPPAVERLVSIQRASEPAPTAEIPPSRSQAARLEVLRPAPGAAIESPGDRPPRIAPSAALRLPAPSRPMVLAQTTPVPHPTYAVEDPETPQAVVPEIRRRASVGSDSERRMPRARLPAPLNCDRPASPGQSVVCDDSGLVAADRQMVDAYESAAAAGVPADVLWKEQVSWLNAREAAARRSPRAVEDLYRERIRDLQAEGAPQTR